MPVERPGRSDVRVGQTLPVGVQKMSMQHHSLRLNFRAPRPRRGTTESESPLPSNSEAALVGLGVRLGVERLGLGRRAPPARRAGARAGGHPRRCARRPLALAAAGLLVELRTPWPHWQSKLSGCGRPPGPARIRAPSMGTPAGRVTVPRVPRTRGPGPWRLAGEGGCRAAGPTVGNLKPRSADGVRVDYIWRSGWPRPGAGQAA